MSRIIVLFFMLITLSGCFHHSTITFDENFSHPELPKPVQPYTFDFKVITEENKNDYVTDDTVFLAVDYRDSLLFRQFLEDFKRYTLEANGVICYYRKELDEQFCENQQRYINRDSE